MSGGARKAAYILPTIITVALIALAGTAIIEQRQERSDRIAEAEKIGSTYFSDVATFEAETQRELGKVRSGDPADLKKVVDEKLEQPPVLGPAPEGGESSKTYRAAAKAEPDVLKPYESLSAKLGLAADAEDFVKAADDVLKNGPIVLLGYGTVFDSGPLRERVIPELNRSLAEFRAVKVPKGAHDVAVKVDGALSYVIDKVNTMADRADSGSSYQFSYDTQYNAARQAVRDYATKVDGDVAEALDRIRGAKPT
ncbi:hypothetical protein [Aeromicrobium sp.]|uniref:hypothetical protein n=1 Tax=Aeromicrobium sp. TaxID=1871063 RepID=UPI003C504CF4